MNNKLKTILILIVIFGAEIIMMPLALANNDGNLVVQFETSPLFYETNFLPGDTITRWVKVGNNSGQTQKIATEAINISDLNNLGDVLNLEIKEGVTSLYNDTLSNFFNAGEVYLSDLANNSTTTYDFIVSFYSSSPNSLQGKSLSFDILIGFQGNAFTSSVSSEGGGGTALPPALTILDESVRVTTTTETSVTIIWTTSYLSTSQVVYSKEGEPHTLDLTDNAGTPPKYGYSYTTPEYNLSPKVTAHSVTIFGLDPDTKYYFRAISHASLAISKEYNFNTLEAKTKEEKLPEEKPAAGGILEILKEIPEKIAEAITPPAPTTETEEGKPLVLGEEFAPSEKEAAKKFLPSLLADMGLVGREISQFLGKILLFLICLLILLFIFRRERKRREEKKE